MSRLRGGAAGAARGAASFLTETISGIRHAGATGQLTVRADSAFYSKAVLATAAKLRSVGDPPPVRPWQPEEPVCCRVSRVAGRWPGGVRSRLRAWAGELLSR